MNEINSAIDKLRAIVDWCNWQSEELNEQFKSIQHIEKAFDFAKKNGFDFLDNDYLNSANLTEPEKLKINKFLNHE